MWSLLMSPLIPVVPVMPAAVAPAAIVVRMVVAAAEVMLVPAMAPFIADVGSLLNEGSLRCGRANARRHRGCRSDREESNAAKRGDTDKCRNEFHDVLLLTLVGGGLLRFGSVHYRGLIPMNVYEFPAMNQVRS